MQDRARAALASLLLQFVGLRMKDEGLGVYLIFIASTADLVSSEPARTHARIDRERERGRRVGMAGLVQLQETVTYTAQKWAVIVFPSPVLISSERY